MEAGLTDFLHVEVGDEQVLAEHWRAREQVAAGAVDGRAAVEDQVVLSADEVAIEREHGVVGGASGEHLLALLRLAGVERGAVDVDDDFCAGQALVLHRTGGVPDVLANRYADPRAGDVEELHALAGTEVARLVEDAVVRQVLLVVCAGHVAIVDHGGGIEDVVGVVDEADDRGDVQPTSRLADAFEHRQVVLDETTAQDQVLRRISGQGELGKGDEIGAQRRRPRGCGR